MAGTTAQPCHAKCISLWPAEDFTVTNISGSKLNVQKLSEWDLQRPIIFLSSKRSPEHRTFRQLVRPGMIMHRPGAPTLEKTLR